MCVRACVTLQEVLDHAAVSLVSPGQDRYFGVRGGVGREKKGKGQQALNWAVGNPRVREAQQEERRAGRSGGPISPACEDTIRLEAGPQLVITAQRSLPGIRGQLSLKVTGEEGETLQSKYGCGG